MEVAVDTINLAMQSGIRNMGDFTCPKEEILQLHRSLELPLVDLEKLRKANTGDGGMGELLQDLLEICEGWGIFRVVNHGISSQLLQKLESQAVRIFSLPSDVKNNVPAARDPKLSIKFFSGAHAHTSLKLFWRECFYFSCEPEGIDHCAEKLWPDGDGKEFSSTIKEHMRISHDLALEILHYITTALGVDSTRYLEQCSDAYCCSLALNHYPICKDPEGVLGTSAHTDDSVLTISYEDQVGGLQIQKENAWFDIKPQPNTFVIYIGDVMQVWSNNRYSSAAHRVVVKKNKRRVSVPFFLCPKRESLIEPAIELINAQNPAKYRGFSFDELIQTSYRNGEKSKQLSEFELI